MRAGVVVLSLYALATHTASSAAQEVGSRVRVWNTGGVLVTGTLVEVDSGAIVVRTAVLNSRAEFIDHDSIIPVTANTRLEVSKGRHSHGGRGALIGLGIGVGLAALGAVGYAADVNSSPDTSDGVGRVLLAGVLVLGGGGALIGFAIGSASSSESWAEVTLDLPPPADPTEMTEAMMRLGLRINF